MKKIYCIVIFSLLVFFSCKKNENTYMVTYKVIETIPGTGAFSVRYSQSDGSLKSEGPIPSETWMTQNLGGYKKGALLSFYLDAPNGTYDMMIYVNGEVSAQLSANGGTGEQLLETKLPD